MSERETSEPLSDVVNSFFWVWYPSNFFIFIVFSDLSSTMGDRAPIDLEWLCGGMKLGSLLIMWMLEEERRTSSTSWADSKDSFETILAAEEIKILSREDLLFFLTGPLFLFCFEFCDSVKSSEIFMLWDYSRFFLAKVACLIIVNSYSPYFGIYPEGIKKPPYIEVLLLKNKNC